MDEVVIEPEKSIEEISLEHHEREAVKADNLSRVLRSDLLIYAKIADNHRKRAEEYRKLL